LFSLPIVILAITGSANSSLSEFTLDETQGGKIRRNKIQLSPMDSNMTNITSVSTAEHRQMKKSRVMFKYAIEISLCNLIKQYL
jgi:hypothetical protein